MSAQDTGNQEFVKASEEVKSLAQKPGNDDLLELYALFKQGIVGDNTTPQPGMFDFTGGAKWKAWTAKKGFPFVNLGMSKADAQAAYIAKVAALKG